MRSDATWDVIAANINPRDRSNPGPHPGRADFPDIVVANRAVRGT